MSELKPWLRDLINGLVVAGITFISCGAGVLSERAFPMKANGIGLLILGIGVMLVTYVLARAVLYFSSGRRQSL